MDLTAVRYFESRAAVYRHTWRGSAITTFLNPVLYLSAMGVGLGKLLDEGTRFDAVADHTYIAFLGPGLLAATAMQVAAGDTTWPVMAGIKWRRTYEAALSTPLTTRHIVYGHLLWTAIRLIFMAIIFAVVLALFGSAPIGRGLLAVAPALLTGLAFAAPAMAMTAKLSDEQGIITLFRFGIVPMFLFSGTFFPITQLPDSLQTFAYFIPLWHGVELTRGMAIDIGTSWWPAGHIAYLAFWITGGTLLAVRFLEKRMKP
tara:strand:+ start:314 stop:1090 length:777 start_codon:yes stop_codon:yes gene_type:complete